MSTSLSGIEQLSINTIRTLTIDAVEKAKSGHPGMPLGCAPLAYLLYHKIMNHNPGNPKWFNRDRFVLSAGHGSMLLYSTLHLSGYEISIDDIKQFRQWGSNTPGHPEFRLTPGVETTTGPLGQGFTNSVGMALAYSFLSNRFNKPGYNLLNHYVYVIASDGDMMEGVSHEAGSFAGHNKLGSLIVYYDYNRISIDGSTDLTYSDDVKKRFESYGWHVTEVLDVNNLDEIEEKTKEAQNVKDKPSMIIVNTVIGFGSPNKANSESSHGAPLGEEEAALTKTQLGWDAGKHFYVPDQVYEHFKEVKEKGSKSNSEWDKLFQKYAQEFPEEAKEFESIFNEDFGSTWKEKIPEFDEYTDKIPTRKASGIVINSLAENLPTLIGGSADLMGSNNTAIKSSSVFSPGNKSGKVIHFGVREHAMGGIMNGMALYGGIIPFGGTFLVFSDYMRPAIRMASLMKLKVIFVFTHDSIGLGEDGPTHQPVEHLSALRAIPGLTVIRPADANETAFAWQAAIEGKARPTALALTRQNLPVIDRTKMAGAENTLKGAYILYDCEDTPDLIIIATGSEVYMSYEAALELNENGIKTRVVSMPSHQLFDMQSEEYKESVLPKEIKARLSVEAGIKQGWEKYTGDLGDSISLDTFGASAPYEVLYEKFGFTKENIVKRAEELMKKVRQIA